MENYCTIYAHRLGLDQIQATLKTVFPQGNINITDQEDSKIILVNIGKTLLGGEKKFQISYRERAKPSYQITDLDSPLTKNLAGMLNFVATLSSENEEIKASLLEKIKTLNCEFSLLCNPGLRPSLSDFIKQITIELDAVVFAQGKTPVGRSNVQHFLDKNLELILDLNGKSKVDSLGIQIESRYFDAAQENATEDQKRRKASNERVLEAHQIKLNKHLPFIVSEAEAQIRTPKEIAERTVVLAVTNMVAFSQLTGEQAMEYLQHFNLWEKATLKEIDFLQNPTDDRKSYETWKCECIWTLLWALQVVDLLDFPDKLANLSDIPAERYPIGPQKDPNQFIAQMAEVRSTREILDMNDLYYRINWACVDARVAGRELTEAHQGVVYERHYALNWLINYRSQAWDEVSCDT